MGGLPQNSFDQAFYKGSSYNTIMDLFDFSSSSFELNPKDTMTLEEVSHNDFTSLFLGAFLLLSYSYSSIEITHA